MIIRIIFFKIIALKNISTNKMVTFHNYDQNLSSISFSEWADFKKKSMIVEGRQNTVLYQNIGIGASIKIRGVVQPRVE